MRAPKRLTKREDQGRSGRRGEGSYRSRTEDNEILGREGDKTLMARMELMNYPTTSSTSNRRSSDYNKRTSRVDEIRKGPWKPEEDEVLLKHVNKYGPRDWSSLRSKGLLLRTGKSCRLRWVNKLRPNLKNGCKFSPEEERIVIELQAQFGNKWAMIATHLQGRTDNDVKNFWSSRQKRLARLLVNNTSSNPNSSVCSSNNHQIRIRPQKQHQQPVIKDSISTQAAASNCTNTVVEESKSTPLGGTVDLPMVLPFSYMNPINLDLDTIPAPSNNFIPFENNNSFTDTKLGLLPTFPLVNHFEPPLLQSDENNQFHLLYDPDVQHQLHQHNDDGLKHNIPLLDHDHLPSFCPPGDQYGTNLVEVDDDKINMGVIGDELSIILHQNHCHVEPVDTFFDDLPPDIFDQIEALPSPPPPPPSSGSRL